jgi:hypothetical protein
MDIVGPSAGAGPVDNGAVVGDRDPTPGAVTPMEGATVTVAVIGGADIAAVGEEDIAMVGDAEEPRHKIKSQPETGG